MEPVLAALERAAATGLMPRGGSILLAVSGGADSTALLYGAAERAAAEDWRLAVGHVHHGWRGREADRDVQFVRDHARRLGLSFLWRRRDARGEARRFKLSPEAGARHARYEALKELAREAGAGSIATAHQRDDRVESFLLARERRASGGALAGPRERRADGVVRPLLDVRRKEILAFLAARGIAFRRDASNGNLRLSRNRIRREVARLARQLGEQGMEELDGQARRQAADRDRVEREFEERVLPSVHAGPGAVLADAAALAACGPDLARLAIDRLASPYARPGRPPVTGREAEQIVQRLVRGDDFRFEAGRRIRFERCGRVLRVAPVTGAGNNSSPKSVILRTGLEKESTP